MDSIPIPSIQSTSAAFLLEESQLNSGQRLEEKYTSPLMGTNANSATKLLLAMLIGRAPPEFNPFSNKLEELKKEELLKMIAKENDYDDVNEQENDSISSTDVAELILIQNIPAEVWKHLFGHLHDSRDKINISNASPYRKFLRDFRACVQRPNADPYWKGMLHSTRPSWLFPMIFPLLLEHLSKSEILECRRVCKHWCSGVDHFLENNAYQRPALEQVKRQMTASGGYSIKQYNSDKSLRSLMLTLDGKNLAYNNFYNAEKMKKLFLEAIDHERCPFVGRSANILENRDSYLPTNTQFLQVFGSHLWFLRIRIEDFPPVDSIASILRMIAQVPNLKKLEVLGLIVPPKSDSWATKNVVVTELAQNLPKLETLVVKILPMQHVKLVGILLKLFGDNLKSLTANVIPVAPNWSMQNVTDLSLSVESDVQLKSLLQLMSPVQRLALKLYGDIEDSVLFQVVGHFRQSLRNLSLNLQSEFFGSQLPHFVNQGVLKNFPCLKTVHLTSCRPVSFNFVLGLDNCLEYLHICLKDVTQWKAFFLKNLPPAEDWDEKLDLMQHFNIIITSSKKLTIYKSNLWKLLPKLRVLSVQVYGCSESQIKDRVLEYRRDIYEKIINFDNKVKTNN